jgi:hypothetical protein
MILMARSVCVETLSARALSLSLSIFFLFFSFAFLFLSNYQCINSFFLFFFLFSFFFSRVLNVLFFPRTSCELFSTYKKLTPLFSSLHILFLFTFYSWLWNFVSTEEMFFFEEIQFFFVFRFKKVIILKIIF